MDFVICVYVCNIFNAKKKKSNFHGEKKFTESNQIHQKEIFIQNKDLHSLEFVCQNIVNHQMAISVHRKIIQNVLFPILLSKHWMIISFL